MPSTSNGISRPLASRGIAVAPAEHRRRVTTRRRDARVGETGEFAQDRIDRGEDREVAPRDAHEVPASKHPQRRHEGRVVRGAGGRGRVDAGQVRGALEVLEQRPSVASHGSSPASRTQASATNALQAQT